ncbi:MAG: hypothetical protein BECKG1743D_GA0114223_111462 [Candidatus Kentron sp. G]|nr:MAG: hypothetical protein BECKG1743F_GA0114225_112511 [Candidatus Kentron sp. G]VFN07629.1 MAG: hypothetical protein BECKG1743E_GA0114224_112571 [Candidatus Kentron sp. G]VFN07775.1 MAG: hypothetical protein BECKG1743D_GA0114223_111462 [Candidatus Kentron sp. G]
MSILSEFLTMLGVQDDFCIQLFNLFISRSALQMDRVLRHLTRNNLPKLRSILFGFEAQ